VAPEGRRIIHLRTSPVARLRITVHCRGTTLRNGQLTGFRADRNTPIFFEVLRLVVRRLTKPRRSVAADKFGLKGTDFRRRMPVKRWTRTPAVLVIGDHRERRPRPGGDARQGGTFRDAADEHNSKSQSRHQRTVVVLRRGRLPFIDRVIAKYG
jgi:hypothetical protein